MHGHVGMWIACPLCSEYELMCSSPCVRWQTLSMAPGSHSPRFVPQTGTEPEKGLNILEGLERAKVSEWIYIYIYLFIYLFIYLYIDIEIIDE